ncbi:MAG: DUF7453 family protein [Methylobacter sp.]
MLQTSEKYTTAVVNVELLKKPMLSRSSKTALIPALAFCLTLGISIEARAVPIGVNITKIVDTETPVSISNLSSPRPATFTNFGLLPAISGDEIAFTAVGFGFADGFYPSDGVFTYNGGSFINYAAWTPRFGFGVNIGEPSLSNRTLTFTTNSYGPGVISDFRIYEGSDGTAAIITDSIPGAVLGTNPSVSEGIIAFSGLYPTLPDNPPSGVYIYNSNATGPSPQATVTSDDPVPGGTGKFTTFGDPSINGGLIAFAGGGSDSENGIYTTDIGTPGALGVVVDTNSPIPEASENFKSFGKPSLYRNKIAFRGSGDNNLQGVYIGNDELLDVVADTLTPIPNGVGNFTNFGDPSLSDYSVAFFGAGNNSATGIYINRVNIKQNPLLTVIDTGNRLDGKNIASLSFGRGGLSGNKLVFVARFSDGSTGIYKAEIATTQNQCRKSYWKNYGFKNQGQCIQYVNTGK